MKTQNQELKSYVRILIPILLMISMICAFFMLSKFCFIIDVCDENTVVSTGPRLDLEYASIGVTLNSNGEFVFTGGISVPLIKKGDVGLVWDLAFETVLNEAHEAENHLFILWESEDRIVHEEEYLVGQPFRVIFQEEDWVREITSTNSGSIVVFVEKQDMYADQFNKFGSESEISNVIVRLPTLNEIRADMLSIWDANNLDVTDIGSPGTRNYQGTVKPQQEYLWPFYWCALDQKTLDQNLENISVRFFVNGEPIPSENIFYYLYDTNTGWKCSYRAVVIGGWQNNSQVDLKLAYQIQNHINDGRSGYESGDYIHILTIEVP